MIFTIITGMLTVAALLGVWLNIKKNHWCFYIWLVTNISWAIIDFYKSILMQGILFSIYACLAVYGIYEWRIKKEEEVDKL